MFDFDKWQDVMHMLRRNQLRTAMTAAGVLWGIFMLVLMLGFGNGLERGVMKNMVGFVSNSVYVWAQRTSKAYDGLGPGRRIAFTTEDIEAIRNEVEGIEALAPRNQLGGWQDGNKVRFGAKTPRCCKVCRGLGPCWRPPSSPSCPSWAIWIASRSRPWWAWRRSIVRVAPGAGGAAFGVGEVRSAPPCG